MNTKLTVGNLSLSLSEEDLEKLFCQYGKVLSIVMPTDSKSGLRKGFAFVEMETMLAAQEAIDDLNGKDLNGRLLAVDCL